jgi:hypothetical protein
VPASSRYGNFMEHRGVRYVIRIGIARGQWQVAIYLADKELPKEATVVGTRRDAEIAANRTISVEEAGRILGIGRMAAYQAVWRGQIPSIRIVRRLLVPLAKLNEMAPPVDDATQPHEAKGETA